MGIFFPPRNICCCEKSPSNNNRNTGSRANVIIVMLILLVLVTKRSVRLKPEKIEKRKHLKVHISYKSMYPIRIIQKHLIWIYQTETVWLYATLKKFGNQLHCEVETREKAVQGLKILNFIAFRQRMTLNYIYISVFDSVLTQMT